MNSTVLVCVTDQHCCKRLIEQGKIIAEAFKINMHVVSVQSKNASTNPNTSALEYLFRESIANGGDMSVYYSNNVSKVIEKIARRNNAEHIVLGASPSNQESGLIKELKSRLPKSFFYIVGDDFISPSISEQILDNMTTVMA